MRLLWLGVGYLGLGLAILGAVLPIVPTVPFLVVAAYGFNRSSPRFHAWLMNHRIFGPPLRHWLENRAVTRRVKVLAIASMVAGLVVGWLMLSTPVWLVQAAIVTAISAWLVTRPEP